MSGKLNNFKITPDKNIRYALNLIKKNRSKALIVTNDKNKLLGTLSDGDIRKGLLKNSSLDNKIENIYNKKPKFFFENKFSKRDEDELFTGFGITLIPIVNKKKKIIDIRSFAKIKKNSEIILENIYVVIMAGGKGSRLEPFTKILPKALIPINDNTVIEHIIQKFSNYGIKKFLLSINYNDEILKAYFKKKRTGYKIKFTTENIPLGTIGSLRNIKFKNFENFFVTNCDTIINANFEDIYDFHKKNKFDITIIISEKKHIIPYGVCKIEKGKFLLNIKEKPELKFFVNVGLYLINKRVIKIIPKNKMFNFTDLINKAQNKFKIGTYKIDDQSWFDVGQWSAFKQTIEKFN